MWKVGDQVWPNSARPAHDHMNQLPPSARVFICTGRRSEQGFGLAFQSEAQDHSTLRLGAWLLTTLPIDLSWHRPWVAALRTDRSPRRGQLAACLPPCCSQAAGHTSWGGVAHGGLPSLRSPCHLARTSEPQVLAPYATHVLHAGARPPEERVLALAPTVVPQGSSMWGCIDFDPWTFVSLLSCWPAPPPPLAWMPRCGSRASLAIGLRQCLRARSGALRASRGDSRGAKPLCWEVGVGKVNFVRGSTAGAVRSSRPPDGTPGSSDLCNKNARTPGGGRLRMVTSDRLSL